MKIKLITFFLFCVSGVSAQTQDSKIILEISNIKSTKGKIFVSLFDKAEGFLEHGKSIQKAFVAIPGNTMTYVFDNLPSGNYAIAIYHDENNDEECNKNWLGVPKEGYGFSTNFKPSLSAPSFEKVKINIKGETLVKIKMIN